MCKVSVIVPICNVEKYLEQCLESLSSQTLSDMEFICLNDGSQDGSSAIAHKFAERDKRFYVIDKPNSGYGKTMNLGLSLAKGEYVGIVESDDFVDSDMFAVLYELAEKNRADVVKSAFWMHTNGLDRPQRFISDTWCEKVISHEDTSEVFDWNPSIWSNLYRHSFLLENGITFFESPGASFQDIAWRTKVFACAKRAFFTKRAFYHYRRDNVNASVRGDGKLFCVRDEYDEAERFLAQRTGWEDKYRYLLPWFRWGHYTWNCFERWLSLGSRWKFYKVMLKEFSDFEQQGLLKRSFWRPNQWLGLQHMFFDPRQYFFDRTFAFLRRYVMLSGFKAVLETSPRLAVYGAGKVGHEALDVLCMYGKRPDCFVVSDLSGNEHDVEGVPVREIDEILPEQSDYVVLIAVGMAYQPEVLELLLEKGFNDVVAFLPEVRQALR